MSLEQWYRNGWLKKHKSSPEEIGDLFAIVERDLADAKLKDYSIDRRMSAAYNAGLQLCKIALAASGYRPSGEGQHFRTIASLVMTLGPGYRSTAETLDEFRKKRNRIFYEQAHVAKEADIERLLNTVEKLRIEVTEWLERNHPKLSAGLRILRRPPASISRVPQGVGSKEEAQATKAMAQGRTFRKFWTQLLEKIRNRNIALHSKLSPSTRSWLATRKGGFHYVYYLTMHEASAELYIDFGKGAKAENKDIFDKLHARKQQIEPAFGRPLKWNRLDERRACRIQSIIDTGGWRDEDGWDELQDEMIDAMVRLEKSFRPHLGELR